MGKCSGKARMMGVVGLAFQSHDTHFCRRSPPPPYAFFALTGLGAGVLLYGSLNVVVHPQVVETWIEAQAVPEPWTRMVEEVSELDSAEQNQMFGEALPIGLRLAPAEER
jgi:hypothetical protein